MKLSFVPEEEFARLLDLPVSPAIRAKLFADACRINTLYAIMRAGSGHIGSSFSAMDVVSLLHLEVLPRVPGAVYFSSKGHDAPGLYAIMAGLGQLPFDKLHVLRRLGGLPGHPDVATEGIPCNTGSLGMGISKAKGMIAAARLDKKPCATFVLTGDGELQEGQIWESLQGAANLQMGELTVIVDHNKIQSDTWIENVSPLGDLEAKFRSFGWEVARCDGHEFLALQDTFFSMAKITAKPKVLIADTIKGKGVSLMEKTSSAGEFEFYKFHSGAPTAEVFAAGVFELRSSVDVALGINGPLKIETLDIPDRPAITGRRLVRAYEAELVDQARKNPDIVVLDADLMIDCGLLSFAESFPERFLECGIAEQDMVSQAGGLALGGKLPIVHSFASFLSARPNEQIFNNATERTKIIYVGSLAGVLPGGPGHSHQSVRDIALLSHVPGLTIVEPCCEEQAKSLLDWAVNANRMSTYLRLCSIPVETPFAPITGPVLEGVGSVIHEGIDMAVISYGPVMLSECWHSCQNLQQSGISVKLIELPWLNKVDMTWLSSVLNDVPRVLCVENHLSVGGQADMLLKAIAGLDRRLPVDRLGINDIPPCGSNQEVLRQVRLDSHSIIGVIKSLIG